MEKDEAKISRVNDLAEFKRIARMLGGSQIHTVPGRDHAVLHYLHRDDDDTDGYPVYTEIELDVPSDGLIFLAVFANRTG